MEERTAHASVQAVGMTMLTVMGLGYVLLTLILFDGEELGPLPIIVGVLAILTFVLWRFDNTAVRVLGVLAGLAVTAAIFFMVFGLFQPFSPIEFIMALLLLVGFVLTVVWGTMAVVAGLRHRSGPTNVDRKVAVWAPSVVAILSVVSVVGFLFTRESVSAEEASGATELVMEDFAFQPWSSTTTDGRLLVINEDPAAHDFTIEGQDVHVYVGPGSETIVDLTSLAPGTYDYVCTLHSDPATGEGMNGQVTISG